MTQVAQILKPIPTSSSRRRRTTTSWFSLGCRSLSTRSSLKDHCRVDSALPQSGAPSLPRRSTSGSSTTTTFLAVTASTISSVPASPSTPLCSTSCNPSSTSACSPSLISALSGCSSMASQITRACSSRATIMSTGLASLQTGHCSGTSTSFSTWSLQQNFVPSLRKISTYLISRSGTRSGARRTAP